jgi:dolichyl-phosphate-mannose-protein mannosyltransferase
VSASAADPMAHLASASPSAATIAPPHEQILAPFGRRAAPDSPVALRRERRFASGERMALALIALWIPLQLLVTWPAPLTPAFDGPWRYDTSIFAYEGALVRHGAMPYVAFWDHKGPLIYLINAAGLSISGGHLWGIWLIGLVTVWLAAALGYRAMRDAFGAPAALVGLVFFIVALGGFESGTNMTEEYALPLAWGAALVLVQWTRTTRATMRVGLALGAIGALAFLLRGNLAGASAAALLTITIVLLRERRFGALARTAIGTMIGAAIAGAPLIAWLAHGGALRAFWDQAIAYNLTYTRADFTQRLVSAIAGVWLATLTAPLLLPAAGLVACVRRLRRSRPHERSHSIMLFALLWVAIELVLASISGRPYDHYFIMMLPPMALLTAALVAELLPHARTSASARRRIRSPVIVAALFALVMLRPLIGSVVLRARTTGIVPARASSQVVQTADYVRAHSSPSDRLLVWGLSGGVYFLAQRPAATKYLFAFPLLTRTYGDSVAPDFLAELRRTPPEIIVDAAVSDQSAPPLSRWDATWHFPQLGWYAPYRTMTPSLEPFYEFVAQNYTPVAVVGPERWTVYRANARMVVR